MTQPNEPGNGDNDSDPKGQSESGQVLAEEHRRMNDAQCIGVIGSFEWNFGEKHVAWSDEMYRINGMEPQCCPITIELTQSLVFHEDVPAVQELKEASFSTPGHYEIGHRILLQNGAVKWVMHRFESLADERGNIVRVHGTLQDITKQKKADAEIHRLKDDLAQRVTDRYQHIINYMDQGFCIVQCLFDEENNCVDWRYLDANPVFMAQTGFEAPIGKTINELVPGVEKHWKDLYGNVALTGKPVRKEGYVKAVDRWMEVYAFGIGHLEKFDVAVLFKDITERKIREQQQAFLLRFSDTLRPGGAVDTIANRALQMLADHLQLDRCYIGVYVLADDRGEFPYQVGNDRVPPMPAGVRLSDFPDALRVAFDRTLVIDDVATAEGLTDTDRHNFGALRLSALVAATLRSGETNPLWSIVAVSASPRHWTSNEIKLIEEVTERTWAAIERAKAEETLRQSEERLQLATGAANVGTFVYFPQEDRGEPDAQMLALYGLPSDATLNLADALAGRIHPDDRQRYAAQVAGALLPQGSGWLDTDIRIIHADGSLHWMNVTARSFFEGGRAVRMSGVSLDITDRKKEEARQRNLAAWLEAKVAERTAELHNHITLLQQAEDLANMGSWEYDTLTGNFAWSSGMYRLFKLEEGTPVTPDIYVQVSVEEDREAARKLAEGIKSGVPVPEITLCLKIADEQRILIIKSATVADETGNPVKVVGVDLDITSVRESAKTLGEQAHFIQSTNEALPDILFVMNLDTKELVYSNHFFEERLDYPPETARRGPHHILHLMHEEDVPAMLAHLEEMRMLPDGQVCELEYRLKAADGSLHWFRDRNAVFKRGKDGIPTEKIGIAQDITERKKGEQDLKETNISLRYANENLQQFATIASHDLQEPLRKLRMFASVLKRYGHLLPEAGNELLVKIQTTSERMSQLIREVLQYSKIAYGVKEFVPTDLDSILRQVLDDLELRLTETGAVIDYGSNLPVIDAIPLQVNQLFYNLLTNALKFVREGVKPVIHISMQTIEATVQQQHAELHANRSHIQLIFKDNGIGFDSQFSEQIFQIFERLHSPEEFEGTGVGLALCKKIAENHNGHIFATAVEGEGASFVVMLPVQQ